MRPYFCNTSINHQTLEIPSYAQSKTIHVYFRHAEGEVGDVIVVADSPHAGKLGGNHVHSSKKTKTSRISWLKSARAAVFAM